MVLGYMCIPRFIINLTSCSITSKIIKTTFEKINHESLMMRGRICMIKHLIKIFGVSTQFKWMTDNEFSVFDG